MQNNNVKNQNNQFPSIEGGANKKSRGLIEDVTRTSIDWMSAEDPNLKNYRVRCVRTTLYHLNGQTSNMIFYYPDFTMFIACQMEAVDMMNGYIDYLATSWVGIEKYQTEYGVMENGVFKKSIVPLKSTMETFIEEGSVYIPGTKGKWISKFAALRLKVEERKARPEGTFVKKGDQSC